MYEYIKYIKKNGQVLYINSMHNNNSFNHIKEEIKQTNDLKLVCTRNNLRKE